jgi:uncharacterized protein
MNSEFQAQVTYFSQTGEQNTRRTLELASQRMVSLRMDTVLVASTSGKTGLMAAEIFRDIKLIVVTHSTGFREPNFQQFDVEKRRMIENSGAILLTCQHALGGVNRAIRFTYQTYQVDEIIANTLRLFGQGVKVSVEMGLMAADAGLIPSGEPVMCVAGTNGGADTAVIIKPANAHRFFDLQILEVVCRPTPGHTVFIQ